MLSEELLRQVRLIEMSTRKAVDDALSGNYKSHFKGHGVQFSEHRVYVPGDDVRHIDWKVSARTRDPLIKKYEEERELSVFLVIDISHSEAFGSHEKLKSQIIAEISAMLAYAAIRTGDQVGALLFAGSVEKLIPPKKGRHQLKKIIGEVLQCKPQSAGTNLAGALEAAHRMMKHRGVVFILSDFICKNFETPLKQLARRHDVVAIQIEDERERVVPQLGMVLMVDPESGEERWVDTSSYAFQNWLKEWNDQFQLNTSPLFKRNRIESLQIRSDADYGSAIVKFFRARSRKKGISN